MKTIRDFPYTATDSILFIDEMTFRFEIICALFVDICVLSAIDHVAYMRVYFAKFASLSKNAK